MTRLEIHLDAETLQPIIQAAVEGAIRRLQAERATTEPDKILVDKPGAAEVLSVSISTIDRWRREEGPPFVDGLRDRNWLLSGEVPASR